MRSPRCFATRPLRTFATSESQQAQAARRSRNTLSAAGAPEEGTSKQTLAMVGGMLLVAIGLVGSNIDQLRERRVKNQQLRDHLEARTPHSRSAFAHAQRC